MPCRLPPLGLALVSCLIALVYWLEGQSSRVKFTPLCTKEVYASVPAVNALMFFYFRVREFTQTC